MKHPTALAASLLGLFFFRCGGFSEEVPLKAVGRIRSAAVKTYGWSPRNPAQHIAVSLAHDVALTDVVDMSVFGRLLPGSTHADAERTMGKPVRVWTDEWGEAWHVYELPNATVEVGCQYYTSGGTPSACNWTLLAIPKADPKTLLLDPQLPEYLRLAVAARARVYSRSFEITTADGQQTVQLFLESRLGPGVYWTDQRRAAQRRGEPKLGAAQQGDEADER
jgi:hypothetical protein